MKILESFLKEDKIMTQRIFDVENEKDMADLWDILPNNIYKIVKDEYQASLSDKNGKCIFTVPYRLIKINWHNKTEITRPIQEATEEWKVIKDFPRYMISSYGRVFSIKRNKILKPYNSHGYCVVDLGERRDNRRASYVHRLVADAFISNPDNKEEVNHINSVRHDNRVENLEWVTPSENVKHAWKYGNARVTEKMGKTTKELYSKPVICVESKTLYNSLSQASEKTGLYKASISRCARHPEKTLYGCHWRFAEGLTKQEMVSPI